MSKAKRIKGKKDYRDLTSDAQFYYEKLVKTLNYFLLYDSDIKESIEDLDNLIDCIKKSYENDLDEAYGRIEELEEKIEELD